MLWLNKDCCIGLTDDRNAELVVAGAVWGEVNDREETTKKVRNLARPGSYFGREENFARVGKGCLPPEAGEAQMTARTSDDGYQGPR